MVYLFLSIFFSTVTVLCFKWFDRFNIRILPAVTVNYLTCCLLGNLFSGDRHILAYPFYQEPWFIYTLILGALFITTFYSIGETARTISVSLSMVAAKLSTVIPVLFGFLLLKEPVRVITVAGIVLSLLSVWLTAERGSGDMGGQGNRRWLLPLIVFLGSGAIDTLMKYVESLVSEGDMHQPLSVVFATAGLIGIVITGKRFTWREVLAGFLLGLPNYASMFFLMQLLHTSDLPVTVAFPLNNIGIMVATALAAFFIFRERFSRRYLAGIALALVSLLLIGS